jgi:hypothetical protein
VRVPELAVLSATSHADHPDRRRVWHALLTALASVDQDRSNLYADVVLAALPLAARRELEALMARTYQYQSDFARRYVSQGRAEDVLTVLDARGVAVPDDARSRITGCTDPSQLSTWLRRAVTAESVDDLFDAASG